MPQPAAYDNISIHALREESDQYIYPAGYNQTKFQSTLSVRRATNVTAVVTKRIVFQSTLSVRRATGRRVRAHHARIISIHALREESDGHVIRCYRDERISIHALREESDPTRKHRPNVTVGFQSTLSVRRATPPSFFVFSVTVFQSTLSVRRATRVICAYSLAYAFQSTLSVRRATKPRHATTRDNRISIHALREESDCAAGHFCPLFETQASCLALRISNNTAGTTNNIPKTSNWLSVSFLISPI